MHTTTGISPKEQSFLIDVKVQVGVVMSHGAEDLPLAQELEVIERSYNCSSLP